MAKKVRMIDACSLKDTLDAAMGTVGNHQSPEIKATAHILKGFGALVDSMPTVDAIPMWWITEKFLDVLNRDKELSRAAWMVRKAWLDEQGEDDGDS